MSAIEWQVRDRMAEAGIGSVRELYNRVKLIENNSVNYAQFARMVSSPPLLINAVTLAAMARVLKCEIGHLLAIKGREKNGIL